MCVCVCVCVANKTKQSSWALRPNKLREILRRDSLYSPLLADGLLPWKLVVLREESITAYKKDDCCWGANPFRLGPLHFILEPDPFFGRTGWSLGGAGTGRLGIENLAGGSQPGLGFATAACGCEMYGG